MGKRLTVSGKRMDGYEGVAVRRQGEERPQGTGEKHWGNTGLVMN